MKALLGSDSLWKQRDFLLLWSGQMVSWIGTEVSGVALPLVVLALTGSPAKAGGVAAMRGLAYVFWAIPAGVVIDRYNRKTVMALANLGSGLAMGSVALALLLHRCSVTHLYIASAVEGSFFVFANLGRFASFPRVVSKEQFPAAAAQFDMASHTALLIGPPLGGFLYQTAGGFIAFFMDGFSYVVNALSLFFIKTPLNVETLTERKAVHQEVREAFRCFLSQPLLRFLNLLTAGRTIVAAGLYLLIVVLAKEHHASALFIGVVFALGAGGGIAGSLLAAPLHQRFPMKPLLVSVSIVSALVFSLYALTSNNALLALVTALFYAADPLYTVIIASYSARTIPDTLRGRVTSLTRLNVLGAHSLGFFVTGNLLQHLGSRWTIAALSGLLLLLALLAYLNKTTKAV